MVLDAAGQASVSTGPTPGTAIPVEFPCVAKHSIVREGEGVESTALRGPGEFLAALPAILGYQPRESVVVVSIRRGGEVGIVLRVDREDCSNPDIAPLLSRSISGHLVRDRATGAFLVSYTDDDVRLECPALEGLRPSIAKVVDEVETWAIMRGRFFSPGCVRESCCPIRGRPVPAARAISDSVVGVRLPAHGLARSFPDAGFEVDEAAKRRVARAGDRWRACREEDIVAWRKHSFAIWEKAIEGATQDRFPTETDTGRLLEALRDRRIRDAILVSFMPDSGGVAHGVLDGSADDEVSRVLRVLLSPRDGAPPTLDAIAPAWDLLGYLTAHARIRLRAPSVTLCAILAWWEGDDEACRCLLARAHEAEPGYRLAGLLECTVLAGVDPGWKRVA